MRWLLVGIALALAGCSGRGEVAAVPPARTSPASDRLDTGTAAVVYEVDGAPVEITNPLKMEWTPKTEPWYAALVEAGDLVQVINDNDKIKSQERPVVVKVRSGRLQGESVVIPRGNLRPLK